MRGREKEEKGKKVNNERSGMRGNKKVRGLEEDRVEKMGRGDSSCGREVGYEGRRKRGEEERKREKKERGKVTIGEMCDKREEGESAGKEIRGKGRVKPYQEHSFGVKDEIYLPPHLFPRR